jgi:hypothetical protein
LISPRRRRTRDEQVIGGPGEADYNAGTLQLPNCAPAPLAGRPQVPMIRFILSLALATSLPTTTLAATDCPDADDGRRAPATLNLRSDNDLYGRADQDQGYTAGIAVTWVSPNLDGLDVDACLPAPVRWLDRH